MVGILFKFVSSLLPRDIDDIYVAKIDVGQQDETKIDLILEILERKRKNTLGSLEEGEIVRKRYRHHDQSRAREGVKKNNYSKNDHKSDHKCARSKKCKEKWGLLGCVELYE